VGPLDNYPSLRHSTVKPSPTRRAAFIDEFIEKAVQRYCVAGNCDHSKDTTLS
jgi:hypothetical protein